MPRQLTKEEFLKRIEKREGYLYQVGTLATANDNYIDWAYEHIMENELECVDGEWRLKGVSQITRESDYYIEHKGTPKERTNREEEWFVLDMYYGNLCMDKETREHFGKVLNYQIPLKNKASDKGVGKIDFVGVANGDLFLAEIKGKSSKESILKAILEVQTYYQMVNKEKLVSDFKKYTHDLCHDEGKKIKKRIFIGAKTKGALQYAENEKIKKLLSMLDIEVVLYEICSMEDILNEI